jgi:hypothetical protein
MLPHLRRTRDAVIHGIALSLGCVISYWLITHLLAQAVPASRDDDLLGGMWSVIATMFVYRHSYDQSIAAALSRMVADSVSFVLCLTYLLVFPSRRGAWPR